MSRGPFRNCKFARAGWRDIFGRMSRAIRAVEEEEEEGPAEDEARDCDIRGR